MCKDVILAEMSWLKLKGNKDDLDEWFKIHNCDHPDFLENTKMQAEILIEINKRNLTIELHEC